MRAPPSNLGRADRMDPLWDRGTIEPGSGNIFHLSRVGLCQPIRSCKRREAEKHDNGFTEKHDQDLNDSDVCEWRVRAAHGTKLTKSKSGLSSAVTPASSSTFGKISRRVSVKRPQNSFACSFKTPTPPPSENTSVSLPRFEALRQQLHRCSMCDICWPRCLGFRCSPPYARETVAEPMQSNRDAWGVDTTESTPTYEDDWDGSMTLLYHDGNSPGHAIPSLG